MSKMLYKLIHGLTTSEKLYFMRNSSIHSGREEKNYLKIYKFYERLKTYDSLVVAQHFQGSTIERHLSSEVNYLKEKILISLFNFNLNNSKRNKIQKSILIVEMLSTKDFKKEALKKLTSIKKDAIKHEEITTVLRLIELEEIILFKEGVIGYKEKLESLYRQRIEMAEKIHNLNSYHLLRQEIRELQFDEKFLIEGQGVLEKFMVNPLVCDRSNCMTIKALDHWYYIQVLLCYLKMDFKSGLEISKEFVDFKFEHRYLFTSESNLPVISNYIYHAALTRNKAEFKKSTDILSTLSGQKGVPPAYVDYILYARNLEFAYYSNDLENSSFYLNSADEILADNLDRLEESQIQYLFMVIVRAAIVLQKYDLGMHYYNMWYQKGVLNYRKLQACLFSLIIKFELGNWDFMEYELIALTKLKVKNPRDHSLIKIYYSFMNSLIKHPEKRPQFLAKFQQGLREIHENNENYYDFISFNYYQWSLQLSFENKM